MRLSDRRGTALAGRVLALSLVALLVTAAPAHGSDVRLLVERAQDLVDREDAAAEELEELEEWLEEARGVLSELTAELAEVEGELEAIDNQLAIAEAELAEAEERADRARERSAEAEAALRAAEEELDEREELLHQQLARAYMYGDTTSLQLLDAVLSQERSRDVVTGLHHLATIVDHEHDNVMRLADLHEEALRTRAQAESARQRRDREVAAAERSRESVESLREEQERVRDEVEERRAEQADLVAEIEEDRDEAAALLDEVRDEVEAARAELGDGDVVCPVPGGSFIDDWHFPRSGGRLHKGNDIFAERGTPVLAVADGVVRRVNRVDRWEPGSGSGLGGKTVSITTDERTYWYYAHLDSVADGVEVGAAVEAGEQLGTVGTTGNARSTPPHLHIGRYVDGGPQNPYPVIDPACR